MGHFIGRRLSYLIVSSFAKRLWSSEGLVDVMSSENGFFFFKFLASDNLDNILVDHYTSPIDLYSLKAGNQTFVC